MVLNANNGYPTSAYITEEYMLYIYTAVMVLKCTHFIIFVALEIKEVLGITIFTIRHFNKNK